jgi:hypothetical protein
MTDRSGPAERAREAAAEHVEAAQQMAAFVTALGDEPDSTAVAEYAALVRRESAVREALEEAVGELGLTVPSEGIGVD